MENFGTVKSIEFVENNVIRLWVTKFYYGASSSTGIEKEVEFENSDKFESYLKFSGRPDWGNKLLADTQATIFGSSNKALDNYAFSSGGGNVSNGAYSFTANKGNEANYAATGLGRNNKAHG
jgi:hypothetical protein